MMANSIIVRNVIKICKRNSNGRSSIAMWLGHSGTTKESLFA